MTLPYRARFSGPQPYQPSQLFRALENKAENYLADDGLVHAVNTALLLGRPLLLTGEPGTGKTQLAANVALQLGLGEPLTFVAKSVSQAQDLFYTFDALGRFKHTSSAAGSRAIDDVTRFIRYNALGLAILNANDPADLQDVLPGDWTHPGKRRSVVLIDEVDKAPRDFPNDILTELDQMAFRIPELNKTLKAARDLRPVVIITSNSERALPDAFLRRCIYYDIPFPTPARLEEILTLRLGEYFDKAFAEDALALLKVLRSDDLSLGKRPSTAELIGWMMALVQREMVECAARGKLPSRNPLSERARAAESLGALIKSRDDLKRAHPAVERWTQRG